MEILARRKPSMTLGWTFISGPSVCRQKKPAAGGTSAFGPQAAPLLSRHQEAAA